MAKLSKRMLMNVTLIPPGGRVADIGCDHAMVPIYLVSEGVADYVIAMDVNEGPLDIARSNIKKAKLEDKIEIRLSDGAEAIELIDGSPECDTILIAGMGGHLALRIIERQLEKLETANRPISRSVPISRLFAQREPIYLNYCDEKIANDNTIPVCADEIIKRLI